MRKRFEQQMETGRIPIGETEITTKKKWCASGFMRSSKGDFCNPQVEK